jgi:hypothetical protein
MFMEDLGSSAIRQVDERLAAIPRFQNITQFPEGLKTLKLYTASHYRTLMKIMVFAIEGLHAKKNDQLVDLYVLWNHMYMFSRKDKFTNADLECFKVKLQ